MKPFNTAVALVEAYTNDFNSRCAHPDERFTYEEIERSYLTTMHRNALYFKYNVEIAARQTSVIRGFGYVVA